MGCALQQSTLERVSNRLEVRIGAALTSTAGKEEDEMIQCVLNGHLVSKGRRKRFVASFLCAMLKVWDTKARSYLGRDAAAV